MDEVRVRQDGMRGDTLGEDNKPLMVRFAVGCAGLGEYVLMHQDTRCQIFEWVRPRPALRRGVSAGGAAQVHRSRYPYKVTRERTEKDRSLRCSGLCCQRSESAGGAVIPGPVWGCSVGNARQEATDQ
ncbi:hypothetical protein CGRA01v4_00090 [Colletotrichum graminicola]|nr:hypothetical protein CGRA01v4_00090 [Colletotrichum graminicola]